jgi:hypothetical protein
MEIVVIYSKCASLLPACGLQEDERFRAKFDEQPIHTPDNPGALDAGLSSLLMRRVVLLWAPVKPRVLRARLKWCVEAPYH